MCEVVGVDPMLERARQTTGERIGDWAAKTTSNVCEQSTSRFAVCWLLLGTHSRRLPDMTLRSRKAEDKKA